MQTIPIDIISNSHTIPMTPEQIRVVEAVSPSVALKRVSEGLVVTVHDIHGEKSETVYDGIKGDPGQSPTAKVVKTENGAVITVTDAEGTTTAEISNGREGDPGQNPTAKVAKTENGAVITVTDAEGTTTAEISNGQDGVSPTISVTDIEGGHRITITDATGAHSFDVMNGEAGVGAVQDVRVNGASVLQDGVANVPIAGDNSAGVIKSTNGSNGIFVNQSNGYIGISRATDAGVKAGTNIYKPIVPSGQHTSAFYGLAKAAGSDEKNSTLPVGQYTDEAKIAIQKMLGIYREWELIADVTIDEDTAQIDIDTDISGQPFALSRMLVRAWLQPATTGTNSYMSANCLVISANDINTLSGAPTKRYMANGAKTFFEYIAEIMGDVCYCTGSATSVPNSTGTVEKASSIVAIKHIRGFRMGRYGNDGSLVPSGSNIKVYGIRV